MTKTVYTVVTGGYDTVKPLRKRCEGYRYVILTDDKRLVVDGWEVVSVSPWQDPVKQSRHLKIMVHEYIDSDVYIYLDANYEIIGDLSNYVNRHYTGGYLAELHRTRKCIYSEASQIKMLKKDSSKVVNAQVQRYNKIHPKNAGLYANGFFIRDRSADDMCAAWWLEVERGSYRDQLSLPVVAKDINTIHYSKRGNLLRLNPHKKYDVETPNVFYFTPNRGDKKLGEWYNLHCSIVPNSEDWICITDHDVCMLTPHVAKLIEDTIKEHGETYDLFSCVTNRLGLKWQTPYGIDDSPDILKHIRIAEKHYKEYYNQVVPSPRPTAGMFMLFQKKTWEDHNFEPGIISKSGRFIDYQFSNGLLKKKKKIGIMKGLYVFHVYRLNKTVKHIEHLR